MNNRKREDILFPITKDTMIVHGKWNLALKSTLAKHTFLKAVNVNKSVIHIDELEDDLEQLIGERVRVMAAKEYKPK